MEADGDATISALSTISTIEVASEGTVTLDANASIGTLDVDGTAVFTASADSITVDNFDDSEGTVTVDPDANLTIENTSTIGNLVIESTGIVTLAAHTGSDVKALMTDELDFISGGKLDLTNNALIWDYVSSSPMDSIRSLVHEGFNSGAWTGNGITSSTAAAMRT